jgi:putative flippase GtrA
MNGHVWFAQLTRYGIVGVVSNAVLYLLYLLFTALGLTPTVAMTLTYAMGVAQTFIFNQRWTFGYRGGSRAAFVRYVLVYAQGYLINLVLLLVLVGRWQLPHQWVQAGAILAIAAMIFLLQRYWVFASDAPLPTEPASKSWSRR